MAQRSEQECEGLFNQIMNSVQQYSTEEISDPERAKSRIIQLLKTHRPVKLADYEYGLSYKLVENNRLIIKEENNGTKVRDYAKQKNRWICSFRASKKNRCFADTVWISFGIVFAPMNHSCNPKDYSRVKEAQDLLKQGRASEALTFSTWYSRRSRTPLNSSLPISLLNNATLSSISNTIIRIRQLFLDENDDDDDCIILKEPVAKRAKVERKSDTEIHSFCRPSDSIIKKKCEKLKIEYNHVAYVLWGKIIFNEIRSTSNNLKTHEFKSPNIYACLSMFFTGKSDSCYLIQHLINTAFRNELAASGTMENKDIEQICTSGIVSNEHLQFISKFLSCRIGIFEDGKLKKYGNWDTDNNALTLILSFVYGLYSIVTDI